MLVMYVFVVVSPSMATDEGTSTAKSDLMALRFLSARPEIGKIALVFTGKYRSLTRYANLTP